MSNPATTRWSDSKARPVRAPRGPELHCANWQIEAAFRMLQNNLDPEVAENSDALVVYGGIGKAARNWPAQAPTQRDAVGPKLQAGGCVSHPH